MIKWGILGAGDIAEKFASDFRLVNDSKIVAVASRSKQRAQTFAEKHQIEKSYGSYLELVNDSEIDVIYIATTHNFHMEHTLLCFEHGKHVLCEKPATVNITQFNTIREEAQKRNLFFMEAMWTAFLPGILKAKEWISSGAIGEIRMIQADLGFCLNLTPERRNINLQLAAGTLLDLGIYPLHFGQLFAESEVADYQIMADMHYSGADKTNLMQLRYRNGILGQYSAASAERYENDGIIIGTKGRIVIKDFHMTKQAILKTEDHEESFIDDSLGFGYNFEIQSVVNCLEQHLTENPIMPMAQTASIISLMDSMRKTIGLKYPFE